MRLGAAHLSRLKTLAPAHTYVPSRLLSPLPPQDGAGSSSSGGTQALAFSRALDAVADDEGEEGEGEEEQTLLLFSSENWRWPSWLPRLHLEIIRRPVRGEGATASVEVRAPPRCLPTARSAPLGS